MEQFEYKTVKVKEVDIEKVLNDHGINGWELVGFHVTTFARQLPDYNFVLKRVMQKSIGPAQ